MRSSTRTSRNAWGASINDPDSAMEWELGSRVMEHLEAENMPHLGEAAVRLRVSRAVTPKVDVEYGEGVQYIDCLITVRGREKELYFCYDVAADGRLMCNIVDPPLKDGEGDMTLVPPDMVVDYTEWDNIPDEKEEKDG